MYPDEVTFLSVILLTIAGWLLFGWPLYLATVYKYDEISNKFLVIAGSFGIWLGFMIIFFVLGNTFIDILCLSGLTALGGILGLAILPKISNK